MAKGRQPWNRLEVEATVAAYLRMLLCELRGEEYNKSERRRDLQRLLEERSEGAIERKHQNISAVLIEMGLPPIDGYKPLGNYQSLLGKVVLEQVLGSAELLRLLEESVSSEPEVPDVDEFLGRWVDPPGPGPARRGREVSLPEQARRVNYLRREMQNAALGRAGESFVVRFEQAKLVAKGREGLAAQVEHVAQTRGDHLGFDVLSFDPDGRERLIEVKTTNFGVYTPFFVTRNEVQVSRQEMEQYHLYRVFQFRRKPRLFGLSGAIDHTCDLDPHIYSAQVSGRN